MTFFSARYLLTVFVGSQSEHIAVFMANLHWSAVTLLLWGGRGGVSVNEVCMFVWQTQMARDYVCVLVCERHLFVIVQ